MFRLNSHEEVFIDLSLDLLTARLLNEVITNYLNNVSNRGILTEPRRLELEILNNSLKGKL